MALSASKKPRLAHDVLDARDDDVVVVVFHVVDEAEGEHSHTRCVADEQPGARPEGLARGRVERVGREVAASPRVDEAARLRQEVDVRVLVELVVPRRERVKGQMLQQRQERGGRRPGKAGAVVQVAVLKKKDVSPACCSGG